MKLTPLSQSLLVIKTHGRLLRMSLLYDIVYLGLAIAYLLAPQSTFTLSVTNATLLALILLFSVTYHVFIIRGSCGGPILYLLLPVNRTVALAVFHAAAILPFLLVWVGTAAGTALAGSAGAIVFARTVHILTVFILIKTAALPFLVLYHANPVLVVLFIIGLVPVGLAVSILNELVFAGWENPLLPLSTVFILLTLGIETMIIKRMKI